MATKTNDPLTSFRIQQAKDNSYYEPPAYVKGMRSGLMPMTSETGIYRTESPGMDYQKLRHFELQMRKKHGPDWRKTIKDPAIMAEYGKLQDAGHKSYLGGYSNRGSRLVTPTIANPLTQDEILKRQEARGKLATGIMGSMAPSGGMIPGVETQGPLGMSDSDRFSNSIAASYTMIPPMKGTPAGRKPRPGMPGITTRYEKQGAYQFPDLLQPQYDRNIKKIREDEVHQARELAKLLPEDQRKAFLARIGILRGPDAVDQILGPQRGAPSASVTPKPTTTPGGQPENQPALDTMGLSSSRLDKVVEFINALFPGSVEGTPVKGDAPQISQKTLKLAQETDPDGAAKVGMAWEHFLHKPTEEVLGEVYDWLSQISRSVAAAFSKDMRRFHQYQGVGEK